MYETIIDEKMLNLLNKRYESGELILIESFTMFSREVSDLFDKKGFIYRRVAKEDRVIWKFDRNQRKPVVSCNQLSLMAE